MRRQLHLSHRAIFILSAAGYSALAIILTYPLVRRLSTTVPHDLGDPLLSATLLWWNAHIVPLSERWWQGFFFWPAPGVLALSDHRLGTSLLATPLQMMGTNAIVAANVAFLATFPLSALAAHVLAFTLVRRHDAAILCGLAYGFCPYRIAHLQHLELLAGFAMPLAIAALHRYVETSAWKWLAAFAAAVFLQALCSSYYGLFFPVLLTLWIVWFVGWRERRALVAITSAYVAALVPLVPLASGYLRVHRWYHLERGFDEIAHFSADLTAFAVSSPLSALWGWTSVWARAEGELFPGLAVTTLAGVGAALAWTRTPRVDDWLERRRRWLLVAAAVCAAIAICGWTLAPWRFDARLLSVSSTAPFKPFSIAVLAIAAWFAASSRTRQLYRERSPLPFYAIAATVLFVCAMGPKPSALGHQFLYGSIYAWLLEIPVFDSVRVPARFALPAMVALSAAAALAFDRVFATRKRRTAFAWALAAAIVAESWTTELPLPRLPDAWPPSRAAGFAAVVELPLGDVYHDIAAMYRATVHGRPVLNGNSGFEPTHYFALRTAFEEHDPSVFEGLPPGVPVLIVVDRREDVNGDIERWLTNVGTVEALGHENRWAFFAVRGGPARPDVCAGAQATIASIRARSGPLDPRAITDGNPHTWWDSSSPQREDEALTLDLGHETRPCAAIVSVGEFRKSYARQLIVETSDDGAEWRTVAVTRTAGATIQAALENPTRVAIAIPLPPCRGRFVRLRLGERHPAVSWIVTDVAIRVASEGE